MKNFIHKVTVGSVLGTLTTGLPCAAQSVDDFVWPEKPKNLQVLPKDWPGSRLRPPMRGFASALGVTCAHCHVGEEGQPLTTYDFASDANPNKERAREMLRMLGSINDHLNKLEPSGDKRVNMWCHTCHAGRPRPMTLTEELGEIYRAKGLEASLEHYTELRNNYYGKGAYNFDGGLLGFGYGLLRNDETDAAVKVFQRNTELFPDSWNAWDSLAEGYLKAGDKTAAKRYYEKSLQLNPDNENAREMLKKISEGGSD